MSNTSFSSVNQEDKYPINALVPKEPIQATSFLQRYPEFDGRGIIVAIFDTGVDPGALGLSKTSTGAKKIIDIVDATGSGDVEMEAPIKIPEDGIITGLSGRKLVFPDSQLDSKWSNPSREVRLGVKRVFEIFPKDLQNRVSKLHKEEFEASQADLLASLKQKLLKTTENRMKKDIESQISHLESLMSNYNDVGPILDIVSWYDGNTWRAVVVMSDEEGNINLGNFKALAAYKLENEFSTFSKEDLMNYSLNFYDDGDIVSIVTTSGSHGTHVCGIVGAYHEDEPELNGVAPGVQFVSVKIGDSRLGSMETGPGLVRGLIAAKEAGCHLINMSYGEPTSIADSGRFARLAKKLVTEHGVIFVSSAGNAGPACTTVGAPAATTPGLISVGAHVTEDMMEAQYALRERLPQNHYSWSSRGPASDGALGVNISAPGCSVSPVPTYTLARNQRMNGTSMSSPNACGGISLLLSALKAQKRHWNAAYIQKAIENTARPIESVNPLAMGYGLLQIEDAYDYIQDFPYDPQLNMWYSVKCQKKNGRGIYLRELEETETEFDEVVIVEPKFQKDTNNLNKLNFEKRLRIISNQDWIEVPKYFHLSNNSNSFATLINPTKLERGYVHLGEIVAVDADDSSDGPIFRIPITVIRPEVFPANCFQYKQKSIVLEPAALKRFFIQVPKGARSANFTIQSEEFVPHSKRILILHALQLLPKESFNSCEIKHFIHFNPLEKKVFEMTVQGGYTLEVVVGQFWSSLGKSTVNLTVEFSGITIPEEISFYEPVGTIPISSELRTQTCQMKAQFDKLCWHEVPSSSEIVCRKDARNFLFTNKYIHDMTLTYKFNVNDDAKYLVRAPILQTLLYESEFESVMLQIFDKNKKLLHTNDFRPKPCQLKKGNYVAILHLRHDNHSYLEGLKQFAVIIEKILSTPLESALYKGSINNALTESKKNKVSKTILTYGYKTKFYIAAPKINSLRDLRSGMWLEGSLKWNSHGSSKLKYIIPPVVKEPSNGADVAKEIKKLDKRPAQEKLKDSLIEHRVKFTKTLLSEKEDEGESLLQTLLDAYPRDLRVLILQLDHLFDKKPTPNKDVIAVSDVISKCIDKDSLAIFFGTFPKKVDQDDYALKKEEKENKEKQGFLINCLFKRCIALLNLNDEWEKSQEGETERKEENPYHDLLSTSVQDLRKWVDTKTGKYVLVEARYARYLGYYGESLSLMKPFIIEKNDFGEIESELRTLEEIIYNDLGWNIWNTYRKNWNIVDFPKKYPLLT